MNIRYVTITDVRINSVQDFQNFIYENNIHLNSNYFYTIFCQIDFNKFTFINLKFYISKSDTKLILDYLQVLYDSIDNINELMNTVKPTRCSLIGEYEPINMTPNKIANSIKILTRLKEAKTVKPLITIDNLLVLIDNHLPMTTVRLENLVFAKRSNFRLKGTAYDNYSEYQIRFPEMTILYRNTKPDIIFPKLILQYLSTKKSILNRLNLKKSQLISQL